MSSADELLTLAIAQLDRDKPEAALATLGRLDGDALETPEPWILRLGALAALERWEEGVRASEQALRRFPEHVTLLLVAGEIAAQAGRRASAERLYLRGLALAPERVALLCAYAVLVAADGQTEKANALVARAAALAPDSDRVAQTRWVLANLRGDDAAARALAKERVGRNPGNSGALTALALEELAEGRTQRAHQLYGSALAIDLQREYDPEIAEALRLRRHPLMWPMIPVERFGMVAVTVAGIVGVQVLKATAPDGVWVPASFVWLGYCLYTWIVPPLLRWWLGRR